MFKEVYLNVTELLVLHVHPAGVGFWKHLFNSISTKYSVIHIRHCRGHDRMVVGFTTTCAISAYNHWSCEFEPRSWRGVLDTIVCDKVCQWLATGRWFSLGTPVFSTNITNRHDITEILLKVALNSINHHIHITFL